MNKRIVSFLTSVALTFTMLSAGVFASGDNHKYGINNKEDAIKVVELAKNGNKDAIETISSLKAFNKEEIMKVQKNLKVNSAEKSKKFEFDDGSAIEITIIDKSESLVKDSESTRQLQAVNDYYTSVWSATTVFGVTVAKYITDCYWTGDTVNGTVWNIRTLQNQYSVFPYTISYNGVVILSTGNAPYLISVGLKSGFNVSIYGLSQQPVNCYIGLKWDGTCSIYTVVG